MSIHVYKSAIRTKCAFLGGWRFAGRLIAPCVSCVAAVFFLMLSACGQPTGSAGSRVTIENSQPLLPVLTRADWGDFIDPVSGFRARVPAGWKQLMLSTGGDADWYESEGHAITFQSPASTDQDIYSDYIMVEFLPSAPAAGFIADETERTPVTIDGRTTVRERIVMRDFVVEGSSIDLVAYQLVTAELGYSMGLYVVGELREAPRLANIFSTFRESFVFPPDNLQVSQR